MCENLHELVPPLCFINFKIFWVFLYSGKSTKTGKMYALKQERPANLWEFYISLEIPARVTDVNIVSV